MMDPRYQCRPRNADALARVGELNRAAEILTRLLHDEEKPEVRAAIEAHLEEIGEDLFDLFHL